MGSIKTFLKKGTAKVKRRKGEADSVKAPASPKTVSSTDGASSSAAAGRSSSPSRANTGNAGTGANGSATNAADPRLAAAQQQLAAASGELDKVVALYLDGLAKEKRATQARLLDACFVAGAVATTAPAFAASLADDGSGADALVAFADNAVASRAERTPSTSERVYGFVDKIKPFLKLAMGVASDAADLAPVGVPAAVKGIVSVFGILLDAVASEQQRSAEIPGLLGDVSFDVRCVLESRATHAHPAATVSSLLLVQETELLTASTVFLRHVLERWLHGLTRNMLRSAFSSTYDDAKRGLVRAVDRFNRALDTQLLRSAQQLHELLAQLGKTDMSDWLQAANESVTDKFENDRDAREKGTCLWALTLADYCAWQQGPAGEPSLFWLNALPGTGKSTITALVVQTLVTAHPDAAVAFFFCDSTNPTLRSLPVLVRTVAAQLAAQLPHMQAHLTRLQDRKDFQPCDPRAENDANRARRLFDTLLRDGLRTDGGGGGGTLTKDTFVVLDGLDELDQRQDLSWLLDALRALPVKVLVSSRREWAILQALRDTERQHCVTPDEVRADIRTHLRRVLSETPTLEQAFQHTHIAPLAPDPVALLTDKANGNFQYVRLVLDDLARASEDGVEAFKSALASLPTGLQTLYDRILARLARDGFLDTARAVVGCLLYAYRPLTVAELEYLVTLCLGRDPHTDPFFDFARTVEKHCGVVLQRVAGGFAIAHETFRAYMIDPHAAAETFLPEPGTANAYAVFYLPAHVHLSVACMQTLSWDPAEASAAAEPAAWTYAAWGWCFHMGALNELRFMDLDEEPLHLTRADMLGLLRRLRAFLESPGMQHWVTREFQRTAHHFIANSAPGVPENLRLAWTTVRNADTPTDDSKDDNDDDAATFTAWLSGDFPRALQAPFCRAWLHTDWKNTSAFEDANKLVHKLMSDGDGDDDGFYGPDPAAQWANLASWARLGGWTPQSHGLPAGNYASIALGIASASGARIDAGDEQALRDHEDRLRRALDDVPACAYWRIKLLAYLATRDRVKEALAERDQLIERAATPLAPVCFEASLAIGKALSRNRRAAEAEANFRLALAGIDEAEQAGVPHPDAKVFWLFIANAWRLSGPEREVAVLQEALERDPKGHAVYTSRLRGAEQRARKLATQAEDKQVEDKTEETKQANQAKPPSETRIQKKVSPILFSAMKHALVSLVFCVLFGGALFMCYESSRSLMDN